ncbi:MAG: queuine tRNA-ribosyltransferase [Candidatus Latescibacterota bacterium]|jgi:queuine tRNA-ribosyltransferase
MTTPFTYELVAQDEHTGARAGLLHTPHGVIETPVFMPVGTQATVKTLDQQDLEAASAQIILGNAYHLYLRPGHELIDRAGGLHTFMNWQHPILTDSGGFQVFSLGDLNKISEEGVHFRSHLDGSSHLFSPEKVMEIEHALGADIIMVFDECTPFPSERDYAKKSMERTLRWAERCVERHNELSKERSHRPPQALFGIVQGSVYPDLRQQCAHQLVDMDLPGYAIGGLAIGEPIEQMTDIIATTEECLPAHKPRYLMGVGLPHNLVEAVGLGIDMFDCVVPTRNARNATAFTRNGRLRLKNAQHAEDYSPIDANCACKTCTHYSRAYIRHLFQTNEFLGLHLATFHNIFFFQQFMREAREAIIAGNFAEWQREFLSNYRDR